MQLIDQNRATYLRGSEAFESNCCTVETSTWRLLAADRLACTELVLLILDDDDDGCSEDWDIAFLRTSGDGVMSLPYVSMLVDVAGLICGDNAAEDPSATGSGVSEWSPR